MLSVDGRDLAPDVRTVPRPDMGKTVAVVVRSNGHDETTILVDYFTTSPMELTLKTTGSAATAASGAASASQPAFAGSSTGAPTADLPDKDPPKKEPTKGGDGPRPRPGNGSGGLPANPY